VSEFDIHIFYFSKQYQAKIMDYIPLVDDDYKLTFVRVTKNLPEDIQKIIWAKALDVPPVVPNAPIKKIQPSPRLARLVFMKKL